MWLHAQTKITFQDWVEKWFGVDFLHNFSTTSGWILGPFLNYTNYSGHVHWFTYCFLVAGRKPTISIACCSLSKSWRRSSSSSILKFCYKEIQIVCRNPRRWENESTKRKMEKISRWRTEVSEKEGEDRGEYKRVREQRRLNWHAVHMCAVGRESRQQLIQKLDSLYEYQVHSVNYNRL